MIYDIEQGISIKFIDKLKKQMDEEKKRRKRIMGENKVTQMNK